MRACTDVRAGAAASAFLREAAAPLEETWAAEGPLGVNLGPDGVPLSARTRA